MAINRKLLAETVCKKEGLNKSVNVGQVREILRLILIELKKETPSDVLRMIEKQK